MSRPLTCDLCKEKMFTEFSEPAYKVTVKELTHSYDGYNPWISKTRLDVCELCMDTIAKTSTLRRRGKK